MMPSSLAPVRHEFLAFRYVFCNRGSQPAQPKSRSAPVALQAGQTACAGPHYAELTLNGPPLTNSSPVGPGKFVAPMSRTSLGAISPDPSNRPAETKPSTSARPVVSQTAPCLSREAWQAWWSGRGRKPPDLSPMPPAVGSQPQLSALPKSSSCAQTRSSTMRAARTRSGWLLEPRHSVQRYYPWRDPPYPPR